MLPSDKAECSRHKLEQKRFHLNSRKQSWTVQVLEHWHRLPRETVDHLPSLDVFKAYLDKVLGKWLWLALLEQRA